MSVVLYGIPTCGTVKKARAWLDARGVDHTFVDMRKTPPDHTMVQDWVDAFGAKAMRNTSGGAYRALPADKATWDDATWVARFTEDPMLIKRPVVVHDNQPARVGWRGSDDELAASIGLD